MLSDTHQRVLSSLVFLLEDKLDGLTALLAPHSAGIAQHWQADLTADQGKAIEADLAAFYAELASLHAAYHLATQTRSPRRELAFGAAQLWEILGDATAAKFHSYGPLPAALAADWDARIQRLTDLANHLLALTRPTENPPPGP